MLARAVVILFAVTSILFILVMLQSSFNCLSEDPDHYH